MPSKYGFGNTRKKSPHKLVNYGGDQKNPVKKLNLSGIGKAIEKGASSDAGQEIIGHLGKSVIDRLFSRGVGQGGAKRMI